jgi:endoglucanase
VKTSRTLGFGWLAVLAFVASACGEESAPPDEAPDTGFVHVSNGRVVDGRERPLWLRGVNFGDWFYAEPEPPLTDHDEPDYGRVAAMGMNVVRLFVNHELLEDETGTSWIDQNVTWAREHGVRLILYATTVPGGRPSDCGNAVFWETTDLQDRFVAMWRSIAERYASETVIAGYDFLARPNPNVSLEQWQELAVRLTAAIREVDPNHALFVQRAVSIGCAFDLPGTETFVRMDDPNVVYAFDRMQPWGYVSQNLESSEGRDYGPYPDTSFERWLHASWDSRPAAAELYLPVGDSVWTEKHFYYTVTDPKFVYATVVLQSDRNLGTAYFDDIVVNEYDENGEFVRTVHDLDLETHEDWDLWRGDANGNVFPPEDGFAGTSPDAHRGAASVTLTGTTTLANLSTDATEFDVTLGYTYEVTGWMKGEQVPKEGTAMIRLDFWGAGETEEGFTKATLEGYFTDFVEWGNSRGVPLAVSEFGSGRPTFEEDGGLAWVNDMIDIMVENDLHFTYHSYHDDEWGIYGNSDGLPDPASVNQPLVNLFTDKLR